MKRIISLIVSLCCVIFIMSNASAQTRVVYGKLYTLDNLPVSGIKIQATTSQTTAVSDSSGKFAIVCAPEDVLEIKNEIFKTEKVKINPNTKDSVKVELRFIPNESNVDMAIGYGYIDPKYKLNAIESLPKNQDFSNYTSIDDLIKVYFSNVRVTPNCVVVRGPGSLECSNCALMVLNGVPVNDIEWINPVEIKNISLIKDGSAAIYGTRGANGVLLIDLKDGK